MFSQASNKVPIALVRDFFLECAPSDNSQVDLSRIFLRPLIANKGSKKMAQEGPTGSSQSMISSKGPESKSGLYSQIRVSMNFKLWAWRTFSQNFFRDSGCTNFVRFLYNRRVRDFNVELLDRREKATGLSDESSDRHSALIQFTLHRCKAGGRPSLTDYENSDPRRLRI